MFKRLSEPTGAVTDNAPHATDTESQIQRPAILVHAGAEGAALTFQSSDGPITFDEKRIKKIVEVHNAYMDQLAQQYGGPDKIPMGAYEPILDSHSDESNDKIIGRLTGRLKFDVRDIPKVGKNVSCAVAEPGITFLGQDTVERVKDGRIYHLSIGISEKTNRIGETSTVVKPAAPGAMLLKQGKTNQKNQGGSTMSVDLKRMKAHTEKMARLSAMKESLGSFTTKLVATSDVVKLARRKDEITHRLSAVCKAGKMMPSEYKNLLSNDGLTKLAKLDDDTLKIALMPFEAREKAVVHIGQVGSTDGTEAGDMAKQLAKQKDQNEYKKLRSEAAADFKRLSGKDLIKGGDTKRMAFGDDDDKDDKGGKKELSGPHEAPVNPGKDDHAVPGQEGDEKQLSHHLSEMAKHLAAGNLEGAKKVHADMCHMAKGLKHMAEYTGDVKSEDTKQGMDQLQQQVDELNTQMSRMAGMVDEMMSAEKSEGEAFEKVGKEHGAVAS